MRHRERLLLLGALTIGCASQEASTRFARELVVPYRSSVVAAAFTDEVVVDQATLTAMRSVAARRNEELRAVVQLQRGVHPYTVFSFTATNHGTRVVATAMFWGDLEEKRVGRISEGELDRIVSAAIADFECSTGAVSEILFGPALVYWIEGDQRTCQGPLWSEKGEALIALVAPIADELQAIYENPP